MTTFSFEQLNFLMIYYLDRFDYVAAGYRPSRLYNYMYVLVFIIN